MARPYKVIGYPVVPIIAAGGAGQVIYGMLVYQTVNGIISMALTLLGFPLYYYYTQQNRTTDLELGHTKRTK